MSAPAKGTPEFRAEMAIVRLKLASAIIPEVGETQQQAAQRILAAIDQEAATPTARQGGEKGK